jgi:hypothetical protein
MGWINSLNSSLAAMDTTEAAGGKRKAWSESEDIALLRQINADRPFAAPFGKVMQAWDAMATVLTSCQEVARPDLDGKKAQHRFSLLLAKHSTRNKDSAAASGVSEEYGEREILLDDLHSAMSDLKEVKVKEKIERTDDALRQEANGKRIRDDAMRSADKRRRAADDDGDLSVTPKFAKIVQAIHEGNRIEAERTKQELELRRYQLELEATERQRDRDLQLELAKMEKDKMASLLEIILHQNRTNSDRQNYSVNI